MHSAITKCDTAFEGGTAILFARLVDSRGEPIQQADVRAIEYSIYELDPCWPHNLSVVARHDNVFRSVAKVVFDSLQTSEPWTIDDVGYNFRHEIHIAGHKPFLKAGFQYQVRYRLTDAKGKCTIVRFQLRCNTSPSMSKNRRGGRGREESIG